jgi:hypothetical protein
MNRGWLGTLLLILVAEKIVQHVFVTWAFYVNLSDIRGTVAVSPNVLMGLGAIIAVLFGVSLWGLWRHRPWAAALVLFLALCDLAGEFAAQGKPDITLNVSFLVAFALLILSFTYLRKNRALKQG